MPFEVKACVANAPVFHADSPQRKFFASTLYTNASDFHPTKPWLLTGSWVGYIGIYNLESGEEINGLSLKPISVLCAKFIPRKNWYIVGSNDGQLRVFNCASHELVVAFEAHSDYVTCIAVHPTAPIVLSGSSDKTIKAWNWDKHWHSIQTYKSESWITHIAFSPKDINIFASACDDGTVKMWSITSSMPDFTIKAHDKDVNCVDFYPGADKPYIVTASNDMTVKVWDYRSQSCVNTMRGHTDWVNFAVFHPTLPIIISGSEDRTVKIQNSRTYEIEHTLDYDHGWARCIAFRKVANEVAVGFNEAVRTIELSRRGPTFSMDHSYVLFYIRDYEIYSADLNTLEAGAITSSSDRIQVPFQTKNLGLTDVLASSLLHSSDGRFVTVVGENKYTIYTAREWRNETFGTGISFAWAPDSNTYAVLETQTRLRVYENFKKRDDDIITSPGDTWLIIEALYTGPVLCARVQGLGCVIFWDWITKEIVGKIDVNIKNIYWSTTGTHVAITSSDALYIFFFDRDACQGKLGKHRPPFGNADIPKSFTLFFTLHDTIQSVTWIGDCLIYATPTRLCYSIVSTRSSSENQAELESHTISRIDNNLYLLGYIPAQENVYVVDESMNMYGFRLSFTVVEARMAVLRGDLSNAKELLKKVPQEEVHKLAEFLEDRDMKELATNLPTDPFHQCITLTMELIATKHTNNFIAELKDNKAQDMVDFLSKMVNSLTQRDRKHALYLLSKLAKSAQVFPQSLELKGVQCDFADPVAAGGYGFIYKGEHEGSTICIKAVRADVRGINTQKLRAHASELIFWAHFSHPNVLPFLGIYPSNEKLSRVCIVSPWMDNGDLLEYLKTALDVPRKPLVCDIISGLQYLHDLDIIHADLKAENVLVSGAGRAMLADFGISRLWMTHTTMFSNVGTGTIHWMAPELLLDFEPHSQGSDIWAFACTCYEMITGATPFGNYEHPQMLKFAFKKGNITPVRPKAPGIGWDEDVWSLATQCWKRDPDSRPNTRKLLDMIKVFNFTDDRSPDPESHVRRDNVRIDYDYILSILEEVRQSAAV